MLQKFREEREKRRQQGAPPNGQPPAGHRSARDDYRDRDRDRGYEREKRFEYVIPSSPVFGDDVCLISLFTQCGKAAFAFTT